MPRMTRIALISDITPVPLTAGPMILFRHLQRMRHHEVLVVGGTIPEPDPVDHHWTILRIPRRLRRLMHPSTRPLFEELRSLQVTREVRAAVREFHPSIIISVWTSEFILPAARLASELGVPLVLICHDDLERMLPDTLYVRLWARVRLGRIYRAAAARLCVSESMSAVLEERYGVPATVMYPMPEDPAASGDLPSRSIQDDVGAGLRVGFCGNIGGGTMPVLLALADALQSARGTLYFTTPTKGPSRDALGRHAAVIDCGFFESTRSLREHFAKTVDAMVVPQSFAPADAEFVVGNFPSKLTETAQFGLPILILAPRFASAARWAESHPRSNLLCTDISQASLEQSLQRLADPSERLRLAEGATEVANTVFHPVRIHSVLESVIERVIPASKTAK